MIKVFGSFFSTSPDEAHDHGRITIARWMADNVPGFSSSSSQKVSVCVGGNIVMPERWPSFVIDSHDDVEVRVMPAGGLDLIVGFFTLRETFRPLLNAITPDMPGSHAAGQSLSVSDIQANMARMGGAVPDIAGSCRRYPDYLLPPRRHFTDPRTQQVEMMLCVGRGEYQIPTSEIRIGDTRLDALGSEAEYRIYDAGADISGDEASVWWQPVEEVGGTSSGGAGLDLDSTTAYTVSPSVTTLDFNGDQITTTGSQTWPANWDNTLILRIERQKQFSFINGQPRGTLQGDFSDLLPVSPGDRIEISSANVSGIYRVHSYSPDTPGTPSTCRGGAAPSSYDFSSSAVTFQIGIGLNVSIITLDSDYVDMPGLISAINSQMAVGTLQASDDSGVVLFTEIGPPYQGRPIQIGGSYSSLLGPSPSFFTGVATSAAGSMEIDEQDGVPVADLPGPWPSMLAVGLVGMRYDVESVSPTVLIVDRLDENGNIDISWSGFSVGQSTSFNITVDESTAASGWTGPFSGCPAGEVTDLIELDFFFPRGLVRLRSDGDQDPTSQSVEVQWRPYGTIGAWQSQTFSFSNSTTDQIGYTRQIPMSTPIRPEVRVRRTGGGSTSKFMKTVQWYGLKARLSAPSSYPWKTLSVKLLGATKLSSRSENRISVLANRILPSVTPSGWGVPSVTRSIGAFFGYIARSVGYSIQQIDIERLYELDQMWQARGEFFDYVFDEGTVREAMLTTLRAGMASLTQENGVLVPVRDGPRTTFENSQGFSPQNMTTGLRRQFQSKSPSDPDGVDIEFVNRDRNWVKETVECRLAGDAGVRAEKIKLDGVTDITQAWRIGMRRRMEIEHRRWTYEFGTELEGLNANYMSYVPILDDLPNYGQSALVVDYDEIGPDRVELAVTEPMEWPASGQAVVAWRRSDGTVSGPWTAETGRSAYHVVAQTSDRPHIDQSMELPHVYFGDVERWSFPALIMSVQPRGLQTNITAVNYDQRVYSYDDAEYQENGE